MAAPARFERTTYRLGGGCSILLSYGASEIRLKFQQAEDLAFGQTLAPPQKFQFGHEGALDNLCSESGDKIDHRGHGAAGSQQIIGDHDP